jgi:hypothetical protein
MNERTGQRPFLEDWHPSSHTMRVETLVSRQLKEGGLLSLFHFSSGSWEFDLTLGGMVYPALVCSARSGERASKPVELWKGVFIVRCCVQRNVWKVHGNGEKIEFPFWGVRARQDVNGKEIGLDDETVGIGDAASVIGCGRAPMRP